MAADVPRWKEYLFLLLTVSFFMLTPLRGLSFMRLLILPFVMLFSASCASEPAHIAKYCASSDLVMYIKPDMSIAFKGLNFENESPDAYMAQSLKFHRYERESYVEYSGALEFVFLSVPGDFFESEEFEFLPNGDGYVVTSTNKNGRELSYFIDKDNSLTDIVENIVLSNGSTISVEHKLCGGNFSIDSFVEQ